MVAKRRNMDNERYPKEHNSNMRNEICNYEQSQVLPDETL
jgi:hypothetical protein